MGTSPKLRQGLALHRVERWMPERDPSPGTSALAGNCDLIYVVTATIEAGSKSPHKTPIRQTIDGNRKRKEKSGPTAGEKSIANCRQEHHEKGRLRQTDRRIRGVAQQRRQLQCEPEAGSDVADKRCAAGEWWTYQRSSSSSSA